MFARYFPSLGQSDFETAYTIMQTKYSGVVSLWEGSSDKDSKRQLLFNFLVAWYLANMFPDKVVGIVTDGGKPLSSKEIGGVSVTYRNIPVQSGFEQFATNTFGLEALNMFQGAPERYQLYG
jgi:hypothetical protein